MLLTPAGNADRMVDALAGAERAAAVRLVAGADTIVATDDPAAWIAAHAELIVGGTGPRAIRLDAAGAVAAAPWS